jgi:drug/metabolite transporter (DMT)-like permease
MKTQHNPIFYLFPLLTTFFWGTTFNVSVIAVQHFSPSMTAAIRFIIAGVVLLPILIYQGKVYGIFKQNWRVHILMALTGVVGFNLFFFMGMRYTTPLNGALIMATNPLVTAFISSLFTKEVIDAKHKIGTTISFIGVIVLLLSGSGKLGHINIGNFFILGSCVSLALYGVLGKRYQKNSTPIITTGITTLIGAIVLCVIAFSMEPLPSVTGIPLPVGLSLLFMGAFGSALAYVFWNYSFKHIGVANTSLFFHFVPVFTVLVSFLFHQTITILQIAAGVIVMLGVLIATGAIRMPSKKAISLSKPIN